MSVSEREFYALQVGEWAKTFALASWLDTPNGVEDRKSVV